MLAEKVYFFVRMALWHQITRIPSKPQVVKRRARRRGVEVTQKVVLCEAQQVEALMATSATSTTINTSVVEREHLSWRAHNRRQTRKTIACSKALPWLEQCHLTHKSAKLAKICVKRAKLAKICVKFPLDFRFIFALGRALRRTANVFRRPQADD